MNSEFSFELAEKIQKYILENIDNDAFTDKSVYEKFAYSPRHLNRVYKRYTGKTVANI